MKVTIRKIQRCGRTEWVVDYRIAGERHRRYHRTKAAAEQTAAEVREHASNGGSYYLSLNASQKAMVDIILKEIAERGLTLLDVWHGYQRGISASEKPLETKTLEDAITELLAHKERANYRPAWVQTLRKYLNRFARGREKLPVGNVTVKMIEDWFDARKEAVNSHRANIGRLSTLFAFAVDKGWCVANPCERVARPRADQTTPAILTLSQLARLLCATLRVQPRLLAWVVLEVFSRDGALVHLGARQLVHSNIDYRYCVMTHSVGGHTAYLIGGEN